MEARKRLTSSTHGLLPSTQQDATKSNGSGSSLTLSPRRRLTTPSSSRKRTLSFLLCRYLGGFLLGCIVLLYVLATWHVLLHSSQNGRSRQNSQTKGNSDSKMLRVLSHPIEIVSSGILDVPLIVSKKPRTIGYFYDDRESSSFVGIDRKNLPLHDNSFGTIQRQTIMTEEDMERQHHLLNSKDYRAGKADTFKDMGKDCVAQYPWQESFHPTCNHIMELDMTHFSSKPEWDDDSQDTKEGDLGKKQSAITSETIEFLANGYWRDVWKVTDENPGQAEPDVIIFKTQRYEHDFEPRNWDRHRRDAVAMDELTSSKHIMDIYGFCGSAGVFEFADGGDLETALWPGNDDVVPWNPQERLIVGYQVVQAIAAVHNHPKEGVAAIAHTDIALGQYVYVDKVGGFKLQDFNRARFIAWNNATNEPCTYEVGNNPGNFRSPEEYSYDRQSEKVDIYSMGNILYCILTLKYPFEHEKPKEIFKKVIEGKRPAIPPQILNTTDPYDQTMLKAIEMSWIHDPKERASARQIQEYILSALKRLNVKASGL